MTVYRASGVGHVVGGEHDGTSTVVLGLGDGLERGAAPPREHLAAGVVDVGDDRSAPTAPSPLTRNHRPGNPG